ncbi:Vacuolar membrane amino acid uptake transporter fnx2 [Lecanosticta acicola]|uniref:Vacuolar membrane amino acid uptake transporter fnx2 n=1 Tax=Lecanosticta acicola TaxID=111012 RepID=A0AAI9EC14_9PEZI|nr:Vacuolar membrane amino acid uptake transporter fnx2 [Lecanosticta acicola]
MWHTAERTPATKAIQARRYEKDDIAGDKIAEMDIPNSSSRTTAIRDERSPLLSDNEADGPLYRTISRSTTAEFLPPDDADIGTSKQNTSQKGSVSSGVYATISVLLLGVFLCNADQSLVLATYGKVASEFNDFDSGSWIISAYIIAQCVAQPLYGKLSDIYGRKACLQTSYILFTIGTAFTGLGRSMGEVIASRAVQGAGAAGMTSMVSIIITDLVPISEVATLRAYVNILQTTGRGAGGVIGGVLTYWLGWRWAFLVQVPPTIIAILLVQWRLKMPPTEGNELTRWQKLKRVDFTGSLLLCLTIFSACCLLETGGQKYPWNSTPIITMAIAFATALILFLISARFAAEPIFPLRLMTHYAVWTNYLIVILQIMVQFSLVMIVPIYFQVTAKATTAAAGAYLIPAFIGNTFGGLISGHWIKSTGLYKPPTVAAPFLAILSVCLCFALWNGHTTVLESFATLPGGMAAGMVSSSAFVGLAAGVEEGDMAVAGSGMYLCFSLGAIAGASAGSAVYQTSLKMGLESALAGIENGTQIMQRALEDITFVQNAEETIRKLIVPAFVNSFHQVNLLELGCAGVCLLLAAFSQGKRLKH